MLPILRHIIISKCEKLIMRDTFNRADTDGTGLGTADTGQIWLYGSSAGRFKISSGAALARGTTADFTYVTGINKTNIKIKATVVAVADKLYPIIFRHSDSNNYFRVEMDTTEGSLKYLLQKRVASITTELGRYLCTPTNGDKLIITVKNDLIAVSLNGAEIMRATDSDLNTNTNVGWYHYNASENSGIDDFEVWAI